MFSNTIEYALESAIVSFNEYLDRREGYICYTDADLKNAFIQRYKAAMKSYSDDSIYRNFQPSNLSKFLIEGNVLVALEFCKSNRWNALGNEYVEQLNKIVSNLNLKQLGQNKLHVAVLEEYCNNKIESINNYKIK